MNYLVDSRTIIDFFNGKTELFHLFDNEESIFVSVVTMGDLFYEAATIEDSSKTKDEIIKISSDFCHMLHIVNIDENIATEYGRLKAKYPKISQNTLWLCATAIARDFVIVTENKEIWSISEVIAKKF